MMEHDPDDLPLNPADAEWLAELRAMLAESDARPALRPSRDLWPDISARLEARADLDPIHEIRGETRMLAFPATRTRRPTLSRWRMAAAAAALVCVSSGATYLATRPTEQPTIVAARAASEPSFETPAAAAITPDPSPPAASELAPRADAGPQGSLLPTRAPLRAAAACPRAARRAVAAVPGVADYDREIADLRAAVADRRGELDSATVAVLVRNLRIIDAAIAASRSALARDPHSPFLGEQLTRALGQKVDLLRTAALLPRT